MDVDIIESRVAFNPGLMFASAGGALTSVESGAGRALILVPADWAAHPSAAIAAPVMMTFLIVPALPQHDRFHLLS